MGEVTVRHNSLKFFSFFSTVPPVEVTTEQDVGTGPYRL